MYYTEIENIANRIIAKTVANDSNLIYIIQVVERMLRPHQIKQVKTLVVKGLTR